MIFFKAPFLYIAPLIIAGILISDYGNELLMWSLMSLQLLLIIGSFFLRGLNVTTIAIAFVLFGNLSMELRKGKSLNAYSGQDHVFLVEVLEQGNSETNWKKNVVNIIGSVENGVVNGLDTRLLLYSKELINEGDVLLANLRVNPIINKGNPGEFNAEAYWHSKNIHDIAFLSNEAFVRLDYRQPGGIQSWLSNQRDSFASILKEYLDGDELALANALILGDKTLLSQEIRNTFSSAGAMHVLAVSGLHVGLVMLILNFIFGRFTGWISRGMALTMTILITWIFAGLVGFPPSVVRAVIMFSIVLIGQLIGRQGSGLNSLGFAAIILLAYDPFLLFDLGFQLSFLAMVGILTLYESVSRFFYIKNKWLLRVWQATAVGIAAQITTLPLVLFHFHQFPNYFWLSNIGVFILAGVLLGNGLALILLGRIPIVAGALGAILSVGLSILITFMQWVEDLPWSVARGFELSVYWVGFCFVVLIVLLRFRKSKVLIYFVPLIAALIVVTQFNRYCNLDRDHIVLFNSNFPLVVVKVDDAAVFFFEGEGNRHKVDRIISDYQKIYPSECTSERMTLGDHTISINDGVNLKIENREKEMILRGINCDVQLIKRLPIYSAVGEHKQTVYMPYLKSDNGINLKNGAHDISF